MLVQHRLGGLTQLGRLTGQLPGLVATVSSLANGKTDQIKSSKQGEVVFLFTKVECPYEKRIGETSNLELGCAYSTFLNPMYP